MPVHELEWWKGADGQFFEVAFDDAGVGRITLVTHWVPVECNYCAYRCIDGAVLETNDFGSALVFVHGGRERIRSRIWGLMADAWKETEVWLVRH